MNSPDYDFIGSNAWWINTRGASLRDKLVLFLLKGAFRFARFSLRILLGRRRRDALYARRNVNFKDFLYRATGPFGQGKLSLEIAESKYGYKIHCPLNREDFIVMTKHEDEMLERFVPEQGDVVVDVGAHMGRYTMTSSRRVGQDGKVVAIEAHPGNFRLLNRNIKLNRLPNVIALNSAAYSKKAVLKLYLPDERQGYTMHHSLMVDYLSAKYKENAKKRYVEVESDTLDHLLQSAGIHRVNWIKIDVEGAELEVLKGAHETLSRNKNISLLVEVHGTETYKPVMELLKSHNFRVEFEKTYDNGEKHVLASKIS